MRTHVSLSFADEPDHNTSWALSWEQQLIVNLCDFVTAAPVYVFNTFRKSEFVNLKKWNFSEMWFWYFYGIKIWRNLHRQIKGEAIMGHRQSKFHSFFWTLGVLNGFFFKILSVFRICQVFEALIIIKQKERQLWGIVRVSFTVFCTVGVLFRFFERRHDNFPPH